MRATRGAHVLESGFDIRVRSGEHRPNRLGSLHVTSLSAVDCWGWLLWFPVDRATTMKVLLGAYTCAACPDDAGLNLKFGAGIWKIL